MMHYNRIFFSVILVILINYTHFANAQLQPVDDIQLYDNYQGFSYYQNNLYIITATNHLLRCTLDGQQDPEVIIGAGWVDFYNHYMLMFMDDGSTEVYDMDTTWPPEFVESIPSPASQRMNVFIQDTIMVQTYRYDGYYFYSIADPENIYLIEHIDHLIPNSAEHYSYHSVVMNDDFIVFGRSIQSYEPGYGWIDHVNQLLSYRRDEAGGLILADSINSANDGVSLIGDRIYIDYDSGISIVNIDSLGVFTTVWGQQYQSVTYMIANNQLYCSTGNGRDFQIVYLYDLPANLSPVLVDSVEIPASFDGQIGLHEDRFIAVGSSVGIMQIDDNSGLPTEVIADIRSAGRAYSILLEGSNVFYCNNNALIGRIRIENLEFERSLWQTVYANIRRVEDSNAEWIVCAGSQLWRIEDDTLRLVHVIDNRTVAQQFGNGVVWGRTISTGWLYANSLETGEEVSSIRIGVNGGQQIVRGDHVYFKVGFDQLHRMDVSNLSSPDTTGSWEFPIRLTSFNISPNEEILVGQYTSAQEKGFAVMILGEEGMCELIARVDLGLDYYTNIKRFSIIQDCLLVLEVEEGAHGDGTPSRNAEIQLWNITNLLNPQHVANIETEQRITPIGVNDQYLVTADLSHIRLFDLTPFLAVPIDGDRNAPKHFTLEEAYPNPFNASVTIPFFLPQPGVVGVRVYNLLGQEVWGRRLGAMQPGWHRTVWDADGSGVSSGVYILRLDAGGEQEVRRVTLVR